LIILRYLVTIVLAFLGLATYLFFYLGVNKPVTVELGERGPFHLLYGNHLGAYHEIGPVISEVEKWARSQHVDCPLTFGEYLDDPNAVDQDRLHSRGGCVLNAKPNVAWPETFSYEERPQGHFAIGHFEGSPAIGPWKVYPKIKDFLDARRLKNNGPVLETYLIRGEHITTEYLFPVEVSR
jgi:hypothetical protein